MQKAVEDATSQLKGMCFHQSQSFVRFKVNLFHNLISESNCMILFKNLRSSVEGES